MRTMPSKPIDDLAAGMNGAKIAAEYPTLPAGAVQAALAYAAALAREELVPLNTGA